MRVIIRIEIEINLNFCVGPTPEHPRQLWIPRLHLFAAKICPTNEKLPKLQVFF